MKYDKNIYQRGPVKFNDYINDKYTVVHNKLYKNALYNYLYNRISSLIRKEILYTLFKCMNECYTEFNDDIVSIIQNHTINENVFIPINIIDVDNKCNEIYFNKILTYINNNKTYRENIFGKLNSLNITNKDQEKYIKYILLNTILLLIYCKDYISRNKGDNRKNIDVSNFIIRQNDISYILTENGLSILETQKSNEDELFIFEQMQKSDIHIGFNSDGYFILDIDEDIDIYDIYDKLYYIIFLINKILLDSIYDSFFDKFLENFKIIEIPQDEYWKPSSIILFERNYPHRKTNIDLTPYWSNYQDTSDINYVDLKYFADSNMQNSIIEKIDYVKGKVFLYEKEKDFNYVADVKYINEDTEIDNTLIENTFVNKIKNMYS